ncbi:hypothetical protein MBLNU459_g2338t1 [Dothideomycetes sp. NU459]
MASIDDLFKKPYLPSSNAGSKRKYEAPDAQEAYKSTKIHSNGDAKGKTNGQAFVSEDGEEEDDDDVEAGPSLPPDEDEEEETADADEEGRFFGGGVTRDTRDALDYLDQADGDGFVAEKIDAAWVRRLGLSFERKISKNSELRAKYEEDPSKFMASEADLDAEIKALSSLSEHPELYPEFAKIGCAASLVSILAHENTDIAIDAIEIISELTDEDIEAEQDAWDSLVEAMLEADLLSLLVQNFARFDESNDADRSGVYHSLSVLEHLASQPAIAERISTESVLKYLLSRMATKEPQVSQNKQYAAEILQVLLQQSPAVRDLLTTLDGIDTLLQLAAAYRKRDPENDSVESEYAENLFDSLAVSLSQALARSAFIEAEGVELALIMLKEGKFSKPRALRVLDHAMSGPSGQPVAEKLVDAAGLKVVFGIFMKKHQQQQPDAGTTEHLIGIFAALLRALPGESAARIRTLAKFVEKEYEKVARLVKLRFEYWAKVHAVDQGIAAERRGLGAEELADRADEWFSRRLDAGLYCAQTLDVILAWLAAEDSGARRKILELLGERDEGLAEVKKSLQEQLEGVDPEEEGNAGEMLMALIECLG